MRAIRNFLIALICAGVIGAAISLIVIGIKKQGDTETEGAVYSIEYRVGKTNEDLKEKFFWLYDKDGNYPTAYRSTSGATVSALLGSETVAFIGDWAPVTIDCVHDPYDVDHSAWFKGWYTDLACTQAFSGTIERGTTGDLILYADIGEDREEYWTKPY